MRPVSIDGEVVVSIDTGLLMPFDIASVVSFDGIWCLESALCEASDSCTLSSTGSSSTMLDGSDDDDLEQNRVLTDSTINHEEEQPDSTSSLNRQSLRQVNPDKA
ncbi:hypothetical protein F2Q68_00025379 [Brassica cretica]|uniref:Uncharacterized protein n=1 Tax=Brassica cretica TaxID=69181 RepID=A0A8S9I9S5_BRACR|nr:hypothetical protein F2Q68_00025379 [Brassica cretica]